MRPRHARGTWRGSGHPSRQPDSTPPRQQPQQSCGSPASPSQSWSRRKVAARRRTCTSAVHDTNSRESEHMQHTRAEMSQSVLDRTGFRDTNIVEQTRRSAACAVGMG
eukprot:343304-Prymnesium_polylepis.1